MRRRRIAEIDALVSPRFLELSARSAKLQFDEATAAATPAEPSWSYRRDVTLELWSINEGSGMATALSPLEWVQTAGLIPALSGDPQENA